jgi:hypothetical protein
MEIRHKRFSGRDGRALSLLVRRLSEDYLNDHVSIPWNFLYAPDFYCVLIKGVASVCAGKHSQCQSFSLTSSLPLSITICSGSSNGKDTLTQVSPL